MPQNVEIARGAHSKDEIYDRFYHCTNSKCPSQQGSIKLDVIREDDRFCSQCGAKIVWQGNRQP